MVRNGWRRVLCALLCMMLAFGMVNASAASFVIEQTRVRAVVVLAQGATLRSTPENKGYQSQFESLRSRWNERAQ